MNLMNPLPLAIYKRSSAQGAVLGGPPSLAISDNVVGKVTIAIMNYEKGVG
jgi:hypothetical protein